MSVEKHPRGMDLEAITGMFRNGVGEDRLARDELGCKKPNDVLSPEKELEYTYDYSSGTEPNI